MTVDDFYTTYPLPLSITSWFTQHILRFLHVFFVKDPEAEASAAGKMAAEAKHEKVPLIVHGVYMHGCLNI